MQARLVFLATGATALVLSAAPGRAALGITLESSFTGTNGAAPYAALTAAGGGLYYGTTFDGGANNAGGIFEFNSATGAITLKDSFTFTNGAFPYAALTAAGGGLYYGTTINGGANSNGGIFEFNSATGAITLKGSFNGTNGAAPYATLTAAGGSLYYGTTVSGGANNVGGIFEFNSATGAITLKGSFTFTNGATPYAALTAAGGGLYYGTTINGGANNVGGIFEFNSATGAITLKGSFTGTNGATPFAALTATGGGLYYGTTINGGANNVGGIFEFNSATGAITLKGSFTGTNGAAPYAALTAAGGGLYYGTTINGGANNAGGIFEFNSATGAITLKDSFTGTNGSFPRAALTAAGGGLYYGTTIGGGTNNIGGIFSLNDVTPASVPGPLPWLGAAAAFHASRRLRRRIKSASAVHSVQS